MTEDVYDADEVHDEFLENDNDEIVAGASGWGISLIAHALILLVLAFIIIAQQMEQDKPPIKVIMLETADDIEKPEVEKREIEEVDVTVEIDEIVDEPIVTELDPVDEIAETEDPEPTEMAEAKGRTEAISEAEAGCTAAFMAIGAGGPSSGKYGNRGGGKKRAVLNGGGSRQSEAAVTSALHWFKRHQSPNGMWDVDGYTDNCMDNPKCEPGAAHTNMEGDVACTSYALMCFLGAGYDHRTPSAFRGTVQKGLDWLDAQSAPATKGEGLNFGGIQRMYAHAVATYALCEAYGMTMDASLRDLAQGGLTFLASQQNVDENGYGLGWNYTPSPKRNDASVSGWAIMAAKAGASAGLQTGNMLEGAKKYLDRAWKADNPQWAELEEYDESGFPYVYNPQDETVGKNAQGQGRGKLACVGALSSVFLGHQQGDIMLETLCNRVMSQDFPKMQSYPCNTYYLYYDTLAMFQKNGLQWKQWNDTVRDMLVTSQRKKGDGCFNGSWDYEGTKFHGHETGRLLSTAYCALSLEVYYRYDRSEGKKRIQ